MFRPLLGFAALVALYPGQVHKSPVQANKPFVSHELVISGDLP
jgi:hypothetical protein